MPPTCQQRSGHAASTVHLQRLLTSLTTSAEILLRLIAISREDMPTHTGTNRFRLLSLCLPKKTGMGTVRHAFRTCLTQDYLSGGCKAGVGKHVSTLTKRAIFFANSIHLVMLILLAQLSSVFINSFVPSNNYLL